MGFGNKKKIISYVVCAICICVIALIFSQCLESKNNKTAYSNVAEENNNTNKESNYNLSNNKSEEENNEKSDNSTNESINSTNNQNNTIEVEKVNFLESKLILNINDEPKKLLYEIKPNNASDKNVKLKYNSKYVFIDSKGYISAIKNEDKVVKTYVTITSSNNKTSKIEININPNTTNVENESTPTIIEKNKDGKEISSSNNIKSVKIKDNDIVLSRGDNKELSLEVTPNNYNSNEIKWTSSNEKIVSVSNDGIITAKSVGNAIITVNCNGTKDSINVTVKDEEVKLTWKTNIEELTTNKSYDFTALSNNSENSNIKYSIDNNEIAIINSETGLLTTNNNSGTITIKACLSTNCITKKLDITKDINISLNTKTLSLYTGDSYNLIATITPDNNSGIDWISSNNDIVTVNNSGKIKAISQGEATITAISKDDNTKTASVKIKVEDFSISLSSESNNLEELYTGTSVYFYAKVSPSNYNGISWSSSDNNIAKVDENGKVRALNPGTVTITATSNINKNKTSSTTINVKSATANKYLSPLQGLNNCQTSSATLTDQECIVRKKNSTGGCSSGLKVYHDILGTKILKGVTPIYAGMDGTAIFYQSVTKNNILYSYGNWVKLTNGKTEIRYAHLNNFSNYFTNLIIQNGKSLASETCAKNNNYMPCPAGATFKGSQVAKLTIKVSKGDILGYVGWTGNAGAVHLHVEIKNSNSCVVDPYNLFGITH